MKRYQKKTQKQGEQSWQELVPIYASSFNEAKERFKDWIVTWLNEINNDNAINQAEIISNEPAADTYSYDNEIFTIRGV